jgi:hypothetical protein
MWPFGSGGSAAPIAGGVEDGLKGKAFLDQLRVIIGADPKITQAQVRSVCGVGVGVWVRWGD